jgi:hypothetical protein
MALGQVALNGARLRSRRSARADHDDLLFHQLGEDAEADPTARANRP